MQPMRQPTTCGATIVLGVSTTLWRKYASVRRMAQKALSPQGGTAPRVSLRLDPKDLARLNRAAQQLGVDRSALLRSLALYGLDDVAPVGDPTDTEVIAEAS